MEFDVITATWNPVVGCLHSCYYCWARRFAETKLRDIERYKDDFKPKIIDYELKKKFHNKFVFVTDMGDLFGDWVSPRYVGRLLRRLGFSNQRHVATGTEYFLSVSGAKTLAQRHGVSEVSELSEDTGEQGDQSNGS